MPYLIDGNNLIGAIQIIDIRDQKAREKLSQLLSRYQKAKGNTVFVVYDGPPPEGSPNELHMGRLRIIYAGPKSDADSRIKSIIREVSSPDQWIVVSSDKQVYSYCQWAGAKVMRVIPFYQDVKQTLESAGEELRDQIVRSDDVDDWLLYFGIEEVE